MSTRTVKPEQCWTSKFVRAWRTLAKGEADLEELFERAFALAEAVRSKIEVIPGWTPQRP